MTENDAVMSEISGWVSRGVPMRDEAESVVASESIVQSHATGRMLDQNDRQPRGEVVFGASVVQIEPVSQNG